MSKSPTIKKTLFIIQEDNKQSFNCSLNKLHLLYTRLYCRFWNLTRSALFLRIKVVDFTTGRDLHPAPEDESFTIHLSTLYLFSVKMQL